MNLVELLVFMFLSVGLGFIGHLISPRYGVWAGVALWIPVMGLWLVGLYRRLAPAFRGSRSK
jgi:pilus assembly protein TadC